MNEPTKDLQQENQILRETLMLSMEISESFKRELSKERQLHQEMIELYLEDLERGGAELVKQDMRMYLGDLIHEDMQNRVKMMEQQIGW